METTGKKPTDYPVLVDGMKAQLTITDGKISVENTGEPMSVAQMIVMLTVALEAVLDYGDNVLSAKESVKH